MPTIETANLAEAIASLGPEPEYWDAYTLGELPADSYDLIACMHYNPAPFDWTEIVRVRLVQRGENEGQPWEWLVDLNDYRRFYVIGSCDYTGWDCQSGADYTEVTAIRLG